MPVTVNGVELRDADIERELDHHHDAANPARLATISAILRLLRPERAGPGRRRACHGAAATRGRHT